jgi:hypothetical protein
VRLFKAAEQRGGVCWCDCPAGTEVEASPRSCPWCGCGWLWFCTTCRKAVTVAQNDVGAEYLFLMPDAVALHTSARTKAHFTVEGRRRLSVPAFWDGIRNGKPGDTTPPG